MTIATVVLAALLIVACVAWRAQWRSDDTKLSDLRTQLDTTRVARKKAVALAAKNLEGWRRCEKYNDDLAREYDAVVRECNNLDTIARDMADKLAALTAHEALVIDREELPAWNDVTGIFHVPVGPARPDFTSEWNASDVQALRDRFDNNEQLALVGGGLSYADKRAEREMDDAA